MKKAIVHIGAAKCASSYIRSTILSRLKSANYYERGGEVCELTKKYCVGSVDVKPCWDSNREEKIVLSHEGLSIYKGEKGSVAKRLSKILPEAKIVYVIREQREWLSSRYSQDLKNYMGIKTRYYSFKEWLDKKFHEELSKKSPTSIYYQPIERIKYDKIINSYKKYFGEIKVIKYESLENDKESFISSIGKVLGENVNVDENEEGVVNKRSSLYREKIQKKMYGVKGHKRISKVLSKLLPYRKSDRRELIPDKYRSIFRDTNESLRGMGVDLTNDYL